MEDYRIVYDSCFGAFLLDAYFEDEYCFNIDACSTGDADRLRSWLRDYDVSYIDPFAVERLRDSL